MARPLFRPVDELIADNQEYCDQGNYDHLANMLTAVALYEMHRERVR